MSARCRAVVVVPLLTLAACLPEATLETDAQKASYGIGLNMGRSLVEVQDHVDMPALMKGFMDGLGEVDQTVSDEDIGAAMTAFNDMVQAAAQEEGLAEGEAYLSENAANEGVMTTESGLQYEVLREGDGDTPMTGQQVTLHYRGMLTDGTEFDSSYDRGEPATFGVDNVIAGFGEAVRLMQIGGQIRAVIPSDLAYGLQGSPPRIGPNQVLIFEIELLEIVQ